MASKDPVKSPSPLGPAVMSPVAVLVSVPSEPSAYKPQETEPSIRPLLVSVPIAV
jgi:hypothetical protein